MKTVLIDFRIGLKNRVKTVESMVRSRLTYVVQSGRMSAALKKEAKFRLVENVPENGWKWIS